MKKLIRLITIIIVLGSGYYYFNGVVTEGYFTIKDNNISEENGRYYLFLEEHKIEVTEVLFKKIEVNKQYHIKYKWNKLVRGKGKIEELNLASR
ncbi:MAG: hypothetical protein K0S34_1034 [Bacillales bacterium]|jgi:hypothetical protein|nr:hypothetical protein [Bacillales bacterium]